MLFYDTIYLKKHTRRMLFMMHYGMAFNEFYEKVDQKFVDPLSNINFDDPSYWRHWKKSCELTEWCYNNKLHPSEFWALAYSTITETGNPTKSFNTFGEKWLLDSVYEKKSTDDSIVLAETYTKDNYFKRNPYYLIYYSELIKKLKNKYGDNYKNILIKMIVSGKLFLDVFEDFKQELGGI